MDNTRMFAASATPNLTALGVSQLLQEEGRLEIQYLLIGTTLDINDHLKPLGGSYQKFAKKLNAHIAEGNPIPNLLVGCEPYALEFCNAHEFCYELLPAIETYVVWRCWQAKTIFAHTQLREEILSTESRKNLRQNAHEALSHYVKHAPADRLEFADYFKANFSTLLKQMGHLHLIRKFSGEMRKLGIDPDPQFCIEALEGIDHGEF